MLELLKLHSVTHNRRIYHRIASRRGELGRRLDSRWLEQSRLLVFHRLQMYVGLFPPFRGAHLLRLCGTVPSIQACILCGRLITSEVEVRSAEVRVISSHI